MFYMPALTKKNEVKVKPNIVHNVTCLFYNDITGTKFPLLGCVICHWYLMHWVKVTVQQTVYYEARLMAWQTTSSLKSEFSVI